MLSVVVCMVTLEDITIAYLKARANKRRSRDSVAFEMNYESNLVKLWKSINEKTFKADNNYAFVVTYPKPREIFATSMDVRIIHHYLDWKLRPIYEKILSCRSFNNRKGMGLHKAIDTFCNDVFELTDGYKKNSWLIHLDIKGYFPNADVEIALKQQLDLIERFYEGHDKEDLAYMMKVCMKADPARHCNIYVPRERWNLIARDKSLFNKPIGVGGAIGFLCWQNAMGMYINDVIKWLDSFDFMRVMVFVDDIYIVTTDKKKTLDLIPELRKSLSSLKVKLNDNKFYCQHFSKGILCLGTMLKYGRKYCNNTSFSRAIKASENLKDWKKENRKLPSIQCSVNSYVGNLKNKNQRKRLMLFVGKVLKSMKKKISWNENKKCFGLVRRKYGRR